ncbi:hypothetical protein GCM10017044_00990 [Kordiimonas sediminis]|uniref:EF-hand domain-containing protein n=1 Tax=Kordiimonas sediminis TaxID=1735581 RepID=A0A919AJF5_9PROT|nr:EF-hand domain-containing protein [Kordiimonas sediminis]GHF11091.1 hypothetical protein GCM10017044_00990 [Kordiimonas sediminis]
MKKQAEKKSETIEVRVSHSEKTAFMDACQAAGVTASHAIRDFISASLDPKQQRPKYLFPVVGILGVIFGAALLMWGYQTKQVPQLTPVSQLVMQHFDKNGDQYLSVSDLEGTKPSDEPSLTWLIDRGDKNGDRMLDQNELDAITRFSVQMQAEPDKLARNAHSTLPEQKIVLIPSDLSAEERAAYMKEHGLSQDLSPDEMAQLEQILGALAAEGPRQN